MKGRRVLITGAGRGLGLEWARQDLADGATVIATARDPDSSGGLRDLAAGADRSGGTTPGRIDVLQMDVSDDASVERAAGEVARRFGAVDDLLLNAGTFGPGDERPLQGTPDEVRRVLEVNSIGPYRVARAFLPLVRKGTRPRIVFTTSRMGSIGDDPSGGAFAYRMSKSALNMLGANLARSLRDEGVLCLLLHPGWVRTRMGGDRAPVVESESVAGMRRVLARTGIDRSGSFLDFQGQVVPW